jgi:hypothetical protein
MRSSWHKVGLVEGARHRGAALILVGLILLVSSVAFGQEAPASAPATAEEEEEAAAKAFAEGRKLYGEGKYQEAIGALLKAYTLRPAPPILLNIARTYEKLKDKKNALKFYKEFLQKALLVDPSRPQVEKVVKDLEREVQGTTGAVTSGAGTETPTAQRSGDDPEAGISQKKGIIHMPVDSAKVNQPITILAELPPDVVPQKVVLYVRRGGETRFREIFMQPQGEAFVATIPGNLVTSTSLQYYMEAIRGTGKGSVLASAQSRLTPFIIVVEGGSPLAIGAVVDKSAGRAKWMKWTWIGSFVAGGVFLGLGGAMAGLAKDRQSALETMYKKSCSGTCVGNTDPAARDGLPKYAFDGKTRDFQSEGKSFANASVGLFVVGGIAAAAGVAVLVLDILDAKKAQKAQEQPAEAPATTRFLGAPWVAENAGGVVGRVEF